LKKDASSSKKAKKLQQNRPSKADPGLYVVESSNLLSRGRGKHHKQIK